MTIGGVTPSLSQNANSASVPYKWTSVPVVGGGFVDGIICHPTVEGLRYCRTDMGGAYRWDNKEKRWIQLLDWCLRQILIFRELSR